MIENPDIPKADLDYQEKLRESQEVVELALAEVPPELTSGMSMEDYLPSE